MRFVSTRTRRHRPGTQHNKTFFSWNVLHATFFTHILFRQSRTSNIGTIFLISENIFLLGETITLIASRLLLWLFSVIRTTQNMKQIVKLSDYSMTQRTNCGVISLEPTHSTRCANRESIKPSKSRKFTSVEQGVRDEVELMNTVNYLFQAIGTELIEDDLDCTRRMIKEALERKFCMQHTLNK